VLNSKKIFVTLGFVALVGAFFVGKLLLSKEGQVADTSVQGEKVTLYKSPTCGCCVSYSGFLKRDGYSVDFEEMTDADRVKKAHNIPLSMQSCHTSIIEDYFVEGHVPLEVIDKLLAEKPDLDGIALPGMPAGSPGMPGLKSEEFIIYGLKDGQVSEFMRI
jgi:hypothetical protein